MPKIQAIGLSGYAGTGKSEVAKYLEKTYPCQRQHIAEPLRGMLRSLLQAFDLDDRTIWAYLEGPLKEQLIPELGVTSRQAQITLGTEWGRELINDDLWVKAWKVAAAKSQVISVNDSVRFPNEAEAVTELRGFTIRISRPGVGPAKFTGAWGEALFRRFGLMWGVHPSERIDLVPYDYEIVNDGTLDDLYDQIDEIMEDERIRKNTSSLVDRMPAPAGLKRAA
jgi:hypothetical protein